MIFEKQEVIALHLGELDLWDAMIGHLNAEEATTPIQPNGWSVKDVMAHLAAWQQRTVARLEAVVQGEEPRFPAWPVDGDVEESLDVVNRANEWIYQSNRDRSWGDVHRAWRSGYLRFLELVRATPEEAMRPEGPAPWLASYERMERDPENYDYHHAEHRVLLKPWLAKLARP